MKSHKEWVSGVYDRSAQEYGKKAEEFAYFGKRLVELANVSPKSTALDVATGRGAVLFPLAQIVGSAGRLVGIDISREMLKLTAQELETKGLSWVELEYMDAEQLQFPDNSFDFVFCGFALFFLPSVQQALSEFRRVLKPGGKLAVSVWGKSCELDAWLGEELNKLTQKNMVCTRFANEEDLFKSLDAAQFSKIQIVEETKLFFNSSSEEWWDGKWARGTRAKLELLSPEEVADLHQRAIAKANNYLTEQGLEISRQGFYGLAEKS